MRLAVIILTKNEEHNIEGAVKSASFADEVVVLDSGSTDRTREFAERLGARFVVHLMGEDGFAGQRNAALDETDADWVFYLDADERITDEAAKEMMRCVKANEWFAYRIKRMNILFGQVMRHGSHAPDYVMRLFPRTMVRWKGVVHESAITELPVRALKGVLCHYTYTDWDRYFVKFNQYTTLMAKKMEERGKRASFLDILLHPSFAFFQFYVLKLGFLDGKQGFIFALNHFFYTMIKYVKLYYATTRMREDRKGC